MRLGHQLAILSLTFLAIPWAGCEFLQANERSLLRLQQQALSARAGPSRTVCTARRACCTWHRTQHGAL